MESATRTAAGRAHDYLLRAGALAGLWWILTGGAAGSWLIGLPTVLAAAAWRPSPPPGRQALVRLAGLVRFVPFFAWRALVGGCDVAWRALSPRLPIEPALRSYPLRLPADGPARVFFANTINLQPGTLTASIRHDALEVHVLNDEPATLDAVRRLETRVADLFGCELRVEEHLATNETTPRGD